MSKHRAVRQRVDAACAGLCFAAALFTSALAAEFGFDPPVTRLVISNEYPRDVALGDLNRDGKLDIVVAVLPQDPSSSRLAVLINRGGRSFDAPVSATGLAQIEDVSLGHIDGDGNLDAVADYGYYGPRQVSLFPGHGDGTFGSRVDLDVAGVAYSASIRDLDDDNNGDLIISTQPDGLTLRRGNGDFTFSSPSMIPTPSSPYRIAVERLNGDGILDLAVTGGEGVSILMGLGGATFAPPVSYYTSKSPGAVRAGDVDGDGRNDLVVTSGTYHTLAVLRGRADGTFGGKRDYTIVDPLRTGDPMDVAIGDVDGDAWPDLVAANPYSNTVGVNLNRGDGTFAKKRIFPAGQSAHHVRLGDLDADGVLDAVVTNGVSNIAILYGVLAMPLH